jgi:hypothetical protein
MTRYFLLMFTWRSSKGNVLFHFCLTTATHVSQDGYYVCKVYLFVSDRYSWKDRKKERNTKKCFKSERHVVKFLTHWFAWRLVFFLFFLTFPHWMFLKNNNFCFSACLRNVALKHNRKLFWCRITPI